MDKKIKTSIQCLGGAGTVTGSKFLVQTPEKTILVDCGLFQGLKKLRLLNWAHLPIDPSKVDLVLLTHGHLDHCGYLPKFVNDGFKGEIWGTAPTLDIAKIIMEDSAKIQEEDAERANRKGFSKHRPAKPLYGTKEVEKVYPLLSPQDPDIWIKISENIECRFVYNGHIIGSTFIELNVFGKRLVFSGDIGRDNDLLMNPPKKPEKADVLFIESTYGGRLHPADPEVSLEKAINEAMIKKGTIIIPGFAVERIQMLMYLLWKFVKDGRIPNVPIYMDSPMGNSVINVFTRYPEWHKLRPEELNEMNRMIRTIKKPEETEQLSADRSAKIIIAASGMASGGRVLTYFQDHLSDASATILLVGYQAEGTRGRLLLDGATEIKLLGKYYPVKASVKNIEGLSAHADQAGLIRWMSQLKDAPKKICIIHGEAQAADALRLKIKDEYAFDCEIPELNEVIEF